ncbi:MAG: winged helix-turn-helix transcriptional regulator [Planctomycetota bacterium]|nr:winged helix-turn-helix transcriptional regulator [Planctomycetota bacterium]
MKSKLKVDSNYPMEVTLSVIGGKWKAVILFRLMNGSPCRFAELRRQIPGISERMLTQQLRELEQDEIVHRKVFPEVPPKVEYSITDYGKTLHPIIEVMYVWGRKYSKRIKAREEKMKS